MKKSNLTLTINELTGDYRVTHQGFTWVSDGRAPYIIIRKKVGGRYLSTYRTLYSAPKRQFVYTRDSIVSRLSGYVAFGRQLDFTIVLTAKITGENTCTFSVKAENEQGYDIQAVYFPAPFNAEKKCEYAYHVDPMRQGFILPDGYKKNFPFTFALTKYLRKLNTGDAYLPLWGRVCDGHTFSAIVETPYDACMFSAFGRHGAFVNSVHFSSSLGRLSYERKIRFTFHRQGNYNTVAKDYRAYLKETGQFVTLEEKIQKNRNIEKIIGAPVLHHRIFTNINEKSKFYRKNGTNARLYATFAQRAEQLQTCKKLGLEKLYIHTDGWGKNGYDNDHPYILPPCAAAGGYPGLKTLADTSRRLGYVFALHDQYRDFYYSSPVYDEKKAVTQIDGSHPYCSIWDGGEHTYLCTAFAPEMVQRTYDELAEHGVDVQGAYLDVFSVMPGDECFNPAHKITRQQSMAYRGRCLDLLNERGMIMSSEEPGYALVNHLALVHHGPFHAVPLEGGRAVGVPIPLQNLIYHDCLIVPWNGFYNWGIPKGTSGDLYCALCAGMPYVQLFDVDETTLQPEGKLQAEFDRIRPLCQLQARLYNQEMVRHEFLGSYRQQRATYADGTTVTIDLDQNTYQVQTNE